MLALDMGKRFITSLLDITMGIAVNTAAFGSAMWMFTQVKFLVFSCLFACLSRNGMTLHHREYRSLFAQLLPEEDLVPDVPGDYVYDSSAPLEQTGDASLYKCVAGSTFCQMSPYIHQLPRH